MSERFLVHAAAHALLVKEGKILMLRRFGTGWMDGLLTPPTGHIDRGEPGAICAVRELREEAGLEASADDVAHAITVHRRDEDGIVYYDSYFIVRSWKGEPKVCEPNKADAVIWLSYDELGNEVVPTVLRAIKAYQAGQHYLEDGWESLT